MGVSKSYIKRIVGLDVVKIIAMLSVVASHSLNVLRTEGISPEMTQIIHSLTAGGVPLFFMVSGYLLLRRKEITYKYALRKIFHIIRYITCACILYWVALAIVHRDISLVHNCFSDFTGTFTLNGTFSLFWFLWAMAFIYAMLPAIHFLYKSHAKAFTAGVFVLGVIVLSNFLIGVYLHREIGVAAPPLELWNWLFFFTLGAILNRYPMKDIKWAYVIPLLLLANTIQRHFLEPVLGCYTNLSFAGSPHINCIVYKHFLLGCKPPMERHRLYQGQRQLLYAGIHSASHTDWASVRAWDKTAMPVYPVAGNGCLFNHRYMLDNPAYSVRRQSIQIIASLSDD